MFRLSKSFIFLFVGLSIFTAYGIHRLIDSSAAGSDENRRWPANANHLEAVNPMGDYGGPSDLSNNDSTETGVTAARPMAFPPEDSGLNWAFEDQQLCASNRLYLKPTIEKIPALFREPRVQKPSDLDIKCFAFIMDQWMPGSEDIGNKQNAKKKANSQPQKNLFPFSQCVATHWKNKKTGKVEHGMEFSPSTPKPCMNRDYVHSIYNYFSDLTDCFGLNQRALMPRIYRESGFHLSAQSPTGAFGAAQLTAPAIDEANSEFQSFQNSLRNFEMANKPSCQRLAPEIQKMKPVLSLAKNNCSKLQALQSPLLSFFYMVISEKQNRDQIDYFSSPRHFGGKFNIWKKMSDLGFAEGEIHRDQIIESLLTLGYNVGAGTAVILLANYLDSFRQTTRRPLKASDLSIEGSNDKIKSFYEYAREHQSTGDPGYLNDVYDKYVNLNRVFKEGTCTSEKFLSLQ